MSVPVPGNMVWIVKRDPDLYPQMVSIDCCSIAWAIQLNDYGSLSKTFTVVPSMVNNALLTFNNARHLVVTISEFSFKNSALHSNVVKSHLSITSNSVIPYVSKFAQSTAVTLPCSVQNLKRMGQHTKLIRPNEILQYFSRNWISCGVSILRLPPEPYQASVTPYPLANPMPL